MLRTLKVFFFNPRAFFLAGASGFLLIFCYPPIDAGWLAWFALVPLLISLENRKPAEAFCLGLVAGIIFFAGLFYWFVFMAFTAQIPLVLSVIAVIGVVLYCALYFGVFAAGAAYLSSRNMAVNMILIPAWWTVLEWIRDRLFTGFGWANLGHSQYLYPSVIQIAEATGVFGVSFWVAAGNVLIKERVICFNDPHRRARAMQCAMIFAVASLGLLTWGTAQFQTVADGPSMRVAVVQGNIPQEMKWDEEAYPQIFEKYLLLTRQAAADRPDLIIWPETAFPGYLWEAPVRLELLKEFVRELGIPLLFGLVRQQDGQYYNSAYLIDRNGKVIARHNKMHLVPFGEYIPFRRNIPFLEEIIPIADFTPGRELTQFPADPSGGHPELAGKSYAVLICFEDTVSRVTRRLVKAGAGMLVNITNDAWFRDTKAPHLHLQAAVFRSVEYRRSLIRAANTGVTCFIDPAGRIWRSVMDTAGKTTYVTGMASEQVSFSNRETFYIKFADVFTYLCFGCILFSVIAKKCGFNSLGRGAC